MTLTQVGLIPIADLRYISVECQRCKARLVIDLASDHAKVNANQGRLTPGNCPCCTAPFDSALKSLLALAEAYNNLNGVTGVHVQIDTPIHD